MRIGSLFAGIGGFDLAAQWVGWETAWFSEIDPYASAVLKKHWPHVPNLGDITQIGTPPKVDLLCGGFPCQDISNAGQRAGITGERSGLWKEYVRLIQEIRPRWVVAENVAVLRSRGLDTVLSDLAALGYDAEWHCIPASAVGAPHQRDRIWIIAYPNTNQSRPQGWFGTELSECAGERVAGSVGPLANSASQPQSKSGYQTQTFGGGWDSRMVLSGRSSRFNGTPAGSIMADAECVRELQPEGSQPDQRGRAGYGGWWLTEPNVGRVAHGVPSRVDRLRCLGNAIVPQVAALIFEAIALEDMIGAAA